MRGAGGKEGAEGRDIKDPTNISKDFAGGPVVKTPHFQCRDGVGLEFDPWAGN